MGRFFGWSTSLSSDDPWGEPVGTGCKTWSAGADVFDGEGPATSCALTSRTTYNLSATPAERRMSRRGQEVPFRATTLPFVVTCLVVGCLAVTSSAAVGPHKVIDLRTQTDAADAHYEVGFCARPTPDAPLNLPGHAFVALSSSIPGQARTYIAIGHTTRADLGSVFLSFIKPLGPVSGHLSEETYSATKEQCLIARVDRAAYEKAVGMTHDPLRDAGIETGAALVHVSYSLGAADCVAFMTSVARAVGGARLVIPTRGATELPLQYLRRLIDAN